jgi:hypothetical protein
LQGPPDVPRSRQKCVYVVSELFWVISGQLFLPLLFTAELAEKKVGLL